MSVDFIKPADRVKGFKPYYFSMLGKKITDLRAQGHEIIRLDMGSPDLPPNEDIIETLVETARFTKNHGYTPYGGIVEFRKGVAHYYKTRFGVELDPQNEIVGLIGSKEGLFDLPTLLTNPGDIVLIPDPGYPVYKAGVEFAGSEIYYMPLKAENHFLPDLKSIPADVAKRAKILWINYPNNPTGAIASLEFFEEVIEYGREHEILIAHDAPYTEVCFDDYRAPSILQIPGSKEVAIEFNSLSKAYNMGGWRLGMASGNPQVVKLLQTFKSQRDNSHFAPTQLAGAAALTGDQTWLLERNETYKERRDIVMRALLELGFTANNPPATIYVWAKTPAPYSDAVQLCDLLLNEAGVSVTPGDIYGEYGRGYIRISLGTETSQVRRAMEKITAWMKNK